MCVEYGVYCEGCDVCVRQVSVCGVWSISRGVICKTGQCVWSIVRGVMCV